MLSAAQKGPNIPLGARSIRKFINVRTTPLPEPPPPGSLELYKTARRRVLKAERDERMDITTAMTPVKTYMGGFTRPKDLRALQWFPGGRYRLNKSYLSPPQCAYEPHTVFILESRYPIMHAPGRPEAIEHVVAVCREGDLVRVLKMYNSSNSPEIATMDNARWPWGQPKRIRKAEWTVDGERAAEVVQKLWAGEGEEFVVGEQDMRAYEEDAEMVRLMQQAALRRPTRLEPVKGQQMGLKPWINSGPHYRSHGPDEDFRPRRDQDFRPRRDHDFQRGKDDEFRWGNAEGSMRPRRPVQRREFRMNAELRMSEVLRPSGTAATLPTSHKEHMGGARELHTSASVALAVVLSPPDAHLHATAYSTRDAEDEGADLTEEASDAADSHIEAVEDVAATTERQTKTRKAKEEQEEEDEDEKDDDASVSQVSALKDAAPSKHRPQYLATLDEKPFWRPLITVTLSTRPLALSLARLSRGLARGTPFYASIENEDRKFGVSFGARMREKRIRRISELTFDIAQLLRGDRGGFTGIRFCHEDRGRSIAGERLDGPLSREQRLVKVGVGEWYKFSESVKEVIQGDAQEQELDDTFEVFGLDEYGKRTDGVEWPETTHVGEEPKLDRLALQDAGRSPEEVTKREKRELVGDFAIRNQESLLNATSARHPSVVYPLKKFYDEAEV